MRNSLSPERLGGWVMALLVAFAFSGSAPAAQPGPPQADKNTLLLLHFDEGQGVVAKDSSGQGSHARFKKAPQDPEWFRHGRFGGCVVLDGRCEDENGDKRGDADGLILSTGAAPDPRGTGFTVELWVRHAYLGGQQFYVARGGGKGRYIFGQSDGSVLLHFWPGGAKKVYARTRPCLEVGLWQHVAFTYDKETVRIYVDGAEKAGRAAPGKLAAGMPSAVVGQDTDQRPGSIRGVYGCIDELRISNVARTSFPKGPFRTKDQMPKLKVPAAPAPSTAARGRRPTFKAKYPDPPLPKANPRDVAVHCLVFIDANANGKRDLGEKPLADCPVSDSLAVRRTDVTGRADFRFRSELHRQIFAIRPRGYRPTTKYFHLVDYADKKTEYKFEFGFAKDAKSDRDEFKFLVTADSQFRSPSRMVELQEEFREISEYVEDPAFHMICGDLTQGGTYWELDMYDEVLKASTIPVYNVYGNHDSNRGKHLKGRTTDNFNRRIAPVWYSWNYGPVHFIGYNGMYGSIRKEMLPVMDKWLEADLASLPKGTPIVFGSHMPPPMKYIDKWLKDGHNIIGFFYGHWHMTSAWTYKGIPFHLNGPIRGGDWGMFTRTYWAAHVKDGKLTTTLRVCGQKQRLEVSSPRDTVRQDKLPVVIQAYDSPRPVRQVTCEIKAGSGRTVKVPLESSGQWTWRGDLDASAMPPGKYTVHAKATAIDGKSWTTKSEFKLVPGKGPQVKTDKDWPGIFIDKKRYRTIAGDLKPPLSVAWVAQTEGVNMMATSPVVHKGRVYLGIEHCASFAPGKRPTGVSCFDAATGERLWHTTTDASIRYCMLVHEGRLYAISNAGTAYCFDPANGKKLWEQMIYPAQQRHRAIKQGITGCREGLICTTDGSLGANATAFVLDWRTGKRKKSFRAKCRDYDFPIEHDGIVYCASRKMTHAVNLATCKNIWATKLKTGKVTAVALLRGDRIYIGAPAVHALDAKTGKVLWRRGIGQAGKGCSVPTFYKHLMIFNARRLHAIRCEDGKDVWVYGYGRDRRDAANSLRQSYGGGTSSVLIVGDVIYVGSETGYLYAFDVKTGKVLWKYYVGVPIKSSPVISGNTIFVADYAGNLWAFVSG